MRDQPPYDLSGGQKALYIAWLVFAVAVGLFWLAGFIWEATG